jgi:hypothetical protein
MKWLVTVALAAAPAAWGQEQPGEHHFAQLSTAKLSVVNTSDELALIEAKDGTAAVLVRLGDKIGTEGLQVTRISKGCLWLDGGADTQPMCVDAGASPRS